MTRTPAYLAAVASSAVPGLDAALVRAARSRPGNRYDVGFVTDTQRRAWVVRVPTSPAVGAQLDVSSDLLPLLHRRLPYGVPMPRGFLAVPEGRAMVYPYLHGRAVLLAEVVPGPGLAAEIGRAVAALHNVDRAVFEEAGVPVYDAETCRTRHLADLDRGAATGHVPTALLSRWERALEGVTAWRFAPTPVHGDLRGDRFLVTFADEGDSTTASVRAVTGWEYARVADPAEDLAAVVAGCTAETVESVVEAYAVARIERPDRHLRHRARLVSELRLLTGLLDAVDAADPPLITRRAAELRRLDDRVADEMELVVADPEPEPLVRVPPVGASAGLATAAGAAAVAGSDAPEDQEDREDTEVVVLGEVPGDEVAGTEERTDEPSDEPSDEPTDESTDEPGEEPTGEPGETPDQTADEDRAPEPREDDTQVLRTGPAADATTVIPAEELAALRAAGAAPEAAPGGGSEGSSEPVTPGGPGRPGKVAGARSRRRARASRAAGAPGAAGAADDGPSGEGSTPDDPA